MNLHALKTILIEFRVIEAGSEMEPAGPAGGGALAAVAGSINAGSRSKSRDAGGDWCYNVAFTIGAIVGLELKQGG